MNPPLTLDPLSQMLGEISAKLDMVQRVQAEDRTAAASWRTEIRQDIATVKETVSDLKNRTNNNSDELADVRSDMSKKVEALRVDVDDYRKRRDQAEGAGKLTKIVWGVLSAIGLGGLIAFLESLRRGGTPHP